MKCWLDVKQNMQPLKRRKNDFEKMTDLGETRFCAQIIQDYL